MTMEQLAHPTPEHIIYKTLISMNNIEKIFAPQAGNPKAHISLSPYPIKKNICVPMKSMIIFH